MATPMPNNIKSVLCSSTWSWSPDNKCTVKFNEDGTGELKCGVEFNVFIASQFDWESRSEVEDPAMVLPCTIEVALKLTKRPLKANPPPISHTALSDAAFQQKIYRLELQKDSFKVQHRTTYGSNPTYEYRLLWDESPFPPLEEWNAKAPAKAGRYWERKDFYKDQIKDAE